MEITEERKKELQELATEYIPYNPPKKVFKEKKEEVMRFSIWKPGDCSVLPPRFPRRAKCTL
jgi:hypothetical protein